MSDSIKNADITHYSLLQKKDMIMAKDKKQYPSSFNKNYTDDDQQNITLIIDWMNQSDDRDNRWLSRRVAVSDGYISTLLTGKHPVPAVDLINKIMPSVNDNLPTYRPGEYIETSIAQLVKHACDRARTKGGFCVVPGAPGVGKTRALKHYKEMHPESIYIEGGQYVNSAAVIDTLVETLNLKNVMNTKNSIRIKAIQNMLRGSGRLIILDETDKCQKDTPDPLRSISDSTGCGIVLAGNIKLHEDVKLGNHRYDLIQSRCKFWPKVMRSITFDDAKKLLKPVITESMITPDETYDEFVRYCGEITGGDARQLIETLADNLQIMYHKLVTKNNNQGKTYKGLSRQMVATIAKEFMGKDVVPPIPRRESAV